MRCVIAMTVRNRKGGIRICVWRGIDWNRRVEYYLSETASAVEVLAL